MFKIIYDEVLEFEDGTPASASQVAKDIVEFLMWASNAEFDERKRLTIKVIFCTNYIINNLYFIRLKII